MDRVAKVSSCDRFLQFRRYLHFNNNLNFSDENRDRFFKTRPLIDVLNETFLKFKSPDNKYSVNEAVIPYKGRFAGNLRQYNPNKPNKWGFKIFVLADVQRQVYNKLLYQRKTFSSLEDTRMELSTEEKDLGCGPTTVIALLKGLDYKNNLSVYCDNYFTIVKLFLYLFDKMHILATGTFRKNRISKCPLKTDKMLTAEGKGSLDLSTLKSKFIMIKFIDN